MLKERRFSSRSFRIGHSSLDALAARLRTRFQSAGSYRWPVSRVVVLFDPGSVFLHQAECGEQLMSDH